MFERHATRVVTRLSFIVIALVVTFGGINDIRIAPQHFFSLRMTGEATQASMPTRGISRSTILSKHRTSTELDGKESCLKMPSCTSRPVHLGVLQGREAGQPFFFISGTINVHRPYRADSGQKLWGIDPGSLKGRLPKFLPDVEDFVSLIDIGPTLLEVAGLPVPAEMTGRSFLRQLTSEASRCRREEDSFGSTASDPRAITRSATHRRIRPIAVRLHI